MKYLLILALILPNLASAERRGSPFPPAIDKRFDELENDLDDNSNTARKYAKITYEPAVDGGASASTNSLGVVLPAGAIITSVLWYVNTVFAGAGGGIQAGSLGFQCSGTNDLIAYQQMTNYPAAAYTYYQLGHTNGYAAGSVINFGAPIRIQGIGSSVATACQVAATVRGLSGDEALSSGKGTLILEYFNSL